MTTPTVLLDVDAGPIETVTPIQSAPLTQLVVECDGRAVVRVQRSIYPSGPLLPAQEYWVSAGRFPSRMNAAGWERWQVSVRSQGKDPVHVKVAYT